MNHKTMDKNSEVRDGGNLTGSEEFSGIEPALIETLKEKGILDEIRKTFKDRTADFIKQHFSFNNGKLRINMISGEFRNFIDGLEIKDIKFYENRVCLINNFILVRLTNAEDIRNSTTTLHIRKQKNGSFRAIGMNKQSISVEI